MASHINGRPLIFQDENSDILPINATTKKNPKSVVKKGANVLGSRKALNDITNKSSKHHGTSSKKNLPKEFNIAEEMCFHDHKKCTEAQHKVRESWYLDSVLSEHKSLSDLEHLEFQRAKTDPESPRCYPEPVELLMSEFSDWLISSIQWASPPLALDSPPLSPISWNMEPNFLLKEENDGGDSSL